MSVKEEGAVSDVKLEKAAKRVNEKISDLNKLLTKFIEAVEKRTRKIISPGTENLKAISAEAVKAILMKETDEILIQEEIGQPKRRLIRAEDLDWLIKSRTSDVNPIIFAPKDCLIIPKKDAELKDLNEIVNYISLFCSIIRFTLVLVAAGKYDEDIKEIHPKYEKIAIDDELPDLLGDGPFSDTEIGPPNIESMLETEFNFPESTEIAKTPTETIVADIVENNTTEQLPTKNEPPPISTHTSKIKQDILAIAKNIFNQVKELENNYGYNRRGMFLAKLKEIGLDAEKIDLLKNVLKKNELPAELFPEIDRNDLVAIKSRLSAIVNKLDVAIRAIKSANERERRIQQRGRIAKNKK